MNKRGCVGKLLVYIMINAIKVYYCKTSESVG